MKSPSQTVSYLDEAARLRKMAAQTRDLATQMLLPNTSGDPWRSADRQRPSVTACDSKGATDA